MPPIDDTDINYDFFHFKDIEGRIVFIAKKHIVSLQEVDRKTTIVMVNSPSFTINLASADFCSKFNFSFKG